MSLDPWRTLGLTPGASDDEIKRAYRRLAKEHHPDAGGAGALPRFLAIQSAYETLISGRVRGAAHRSGAGYGGRRGHGQSPADGPPWRADPARARATREAWTRGGGAASSRGSGGRPGDRPGHRAGDRTGDRSGDQADDRTGDRPREQRRPGDGSQPRPGRARKATPGSTTYDDAHHEPDEPGWTGSSWYGQSSGTYWTINPREYADPRKHGPDYQARARRFADTQGAPADVGPGTSPPETSPGSPARRRPTETSPRDRPQGPRAEPASRRPAGRAAPSGGAGDGSPPAGPVGRPPFPGLPQLVRWIVTTPGRPRVRIGLALAAWPPPGVAALVVADELTGCARSAASCPGPEQLAVWSAAAQLAILAILVALPPLARLGAVGSLAALIAALPVAGVLTAAGASYAPEGGAGTLLVLLGLAYLSGAIAGWRVRRGLGSSSA